VPPTEPADQGDEGDSDTVGEVAGSRSPAPTIEELLAQMERQLPAPQASTEPAAAAKEMVTAEARESAAPAAITAEEAAAAEAREEAPAEAGLVNIASILGAPTVTVVRSSL
jgi:hypothetical protein